ncbi:tyrosine-protein phosphatase non-receptor type 22 [Oryzias melastigma]|uniref:tyrosine-protein phosphatase non-receptor type 22 n=1 Tax=Oryzias melastigma TaxID=30732 RepID=UPI000CF7F235|nr:tyrosine-protein phosphatase non-receptor type 22 [Oryzias melastigma]
MEHQARILRDILTHLERQEAAGEEDQNGIGGEFAKLKNQSIKYRVDKTFPTKSAEKTENIKKNRYKDIVPFDHSRVKLSLITSKKDTDYVNASFIKGVSESRAYIATQGPLPHTVVDFLRMIWEFNVQIIVMACREFEMGKKKCEIYWPQTLGETFTCEPFTVFCDSEENKGDYLTRTLRMTYLDCSRTLKQLHYYNWPDHGVPDTIPPILDMLYEMRSFQPHDDIPICIHCSAGCGRTGVLCVIDYTWNLLRKQMITSDFNIFTLVQDMRTQRPSVVQTKEQYLLVYRTIRVLFQRYLDCMEPDRPQNKVPELPDSEPELSDLSDDSEFTPDQRHLLDEEDDRWNPPQHLPTLPEVLVTTHGFNMEPRTSPKRVHTDLREPAEESIQENGDVLTRSTPPAKVVAEAICLMVEDPYFDTPLSSPSPEEAPAEDSTWTLSPIFQTPSLLLNDETLTSNSPAPDSISGESPPPLPERTPESFVLAVNEELPDPCERLSVVFPPNFAAEAVKELAGSPPSPVPPLPERTPESFELATDPAPCDQQPVVPSAPTLDSGGGSSNQIWSESAGAVHMRDSSCVKKKSWRAEVALSAPMIKFDMTSNPNNHCVIMDPHPPPPLLQVERSAPVCPQPAQPAPKVGLSSEWAGRSEPKGFLHSFIRSKSVRAKSSKQEPLAVFRPLAPLPVAAAGGGSAQAEHDVSLRPSSTDNSGTNSDKSSEKGITRSKSLKCLKNKLRPKIAPPPPPTQPAAPPQSLSSSLAGFKLGFGSRFRKPKGPRAYPETWV